MRRNLAAATIAGSLLSGVAVGAVVAGPGLVGAQDSTTTTEAPATGPQAPAARQQRLRDTLRPLVADGTITAAQLDAVVAALDAAKPDRGMGRHGPKGLHSGLEAAAGAIGTDVDALRQQLQSGSSLAEIATAAGVEPQAVIDAMVGDAQTRLDAAVAAGKLTAEQAQARTADLTARVTAIVNGERPPFGPMGGGRMGGPGNGS